MWFGEAIQYILRHDDLIFMRFDPDTVSSDRFRSDRYISIQNGPTEIAISSGNGIHID